MQATYLAPPVAQVWFCSVLCNLHQRNIQGSTQHWGKGVVVGGWGGAVILPIYHHIIGTKARVSWHPLLVLTRMRGLSCEMMKGSSCARRISSLPNPPPPPSTRSHVQEVFPTRLWLVIAAMALKGGRQPMPSKHWGKKQRKA